MNWIPFALLAGALVLAGCTNSDESTDPYADATGDGGAGGDGGSSVKGTLNVEENGSENDTAGNDTATNETGTGG